MSEHKCNVTLMKVWWLALIILLSQTLMFVDSKFDFLYPDSNEVVFETETILLTCAPQSKVTVLNVSVSDAHGSIIVEFNRNVGLKPQVEAVLPTSTQLVLLIIANSENRSSLTCIIFENGTSVSENHLNLDIRPKDQPVCLMGAGPAVEEGDIIELTCYEALSSTNGSWRQIKDNGINVDLLTESALNSFNDQFKQRHTSNITVSSDDDGSVFACDVGGQRCLTDEITVVNELTLGFTSESPDRLKINEQHMVECNVSQPHARITWNHDYEANNDVLVTFNDSFLYVTLPSDTTLRHGLILNFTCVATLLRFEASGTYQLFVDLTASNPTQESTTSKVKDTAQVTEENTKSTPGVLNENDLILYFILGGIAAVILVALIIFISIAICVVEANSKKKETNQIKPKPVENVVNSSEGASPRNLYSQVRKDTNRASAMSRPDSILYTYVNNGHVLIDEEEIYNENLDWERLNGLSVD